MCFLLRQQPLSLKEPGFFFGKWGAGASTGSWEPHVFIGILNNNQIWTKNEQKLDSRSKMSLWIGNLNYGWAATRQLGAEV